MDSLFVPKIYGVTAAHPTLEYNNYRWFNPECAAFSAWNLDLSSGNILEKEADHWSIWEPESANGRATRATATYAKSTGTISDLHTQHQWRPITVEHKNNSKLAIKSKGRYHVLQGENIDEAAWYSPQHEK